MHQKENDFKMLDYKKLFKVSYYAKYGKVFFYEKKSKNNLQLYGEQF